MDGIMKIKEWLKVCPNFEISKIEENSIIDKSLIWGKLLNNSFNGVTFAELKYFLVDSYEWNTKETLKNDELRGNL